MKKAFELHKRCFRCLEKSPDVFQTLESKHSVNIKLVDQSGQYLIVVFGKAEDVERGFAELRIILEGLKEKEKETYYVLDHQLEIFRKEHQKIEFSEVIEHQKSSDYIKITAYGRRWDLLYFEKVEHPRKQPKREDDFVTAGGASQGFSRSDINFETRSIQSTVGFNEVDYAEMNIGSSQNFSRSNIHDAKSLQSTVGFNEVDCEEMNIGSSQKSIRSNLYETKSLKSTIGFNEVNVDSAEMNIRDEEEEDEGEDVEGKDQENERYIPLELTEGLRNMSTKKRIPLPEETRICVVGRVSCGKSSLINHMISSDKRRVYVCPSGAMTCTRSISEHRYCEGRVNEETVRSILKVGNAEHGKKSVLEVKTIKNMLLKNAIFVDTPGLNDYFDLVEKPNRVVENEEKEKVRAGIEKQIKISDVVLFLVSPIDLEDEETISRTLARIVELQSNVIVVITKFDEIFESNIPDIVYSEEELTTDIGEKNSYRSLKIIEKYSKKFDLFGCSVCFCQVHEPVDEETGPNFFSDEMVYDGIFGMNFPRKDSLIYIRSQLRKDIQSSHYPWIPMKFYGDSTKKKNLRTKKKVVYGGGIAAGFAGVLGASVFGLGAILVTGGVMAQVVPGLGTAFGAAAIASGLAAIGGSMAGGITVITGIGAGVGVGSAIVGGVVFTGIMVGNQLTLAKYVAKLPLSARMTMSLLREEAGKFISEVRVEKKDWKKLIEYEKKCHIKSNKMLKKYFGLDPEKWEEYIDSVIIQYEEVWYCVSGVFRGPFLVHVRDVSRISQKLEKE